MTVDQDTRLADFLPKLADGQTLAPGTYTVTVRKADEPFSEAQQWTVTVSNEP